MPELPTVAEAALPGFKSRDWIGIFAPAGTPPAVVLALNTEINRIMRVPEMAAKLAADGAEPVPPNTPAEFNAIFLAEYTKWEQYFRRTATQK